MAKWPQFVTIWITNAKCVLNFSIYLIFKMGISFKHIPAIKLSFLVYAINAIRKPQMLKTCANLTLQLENSILHYFGILVLRPYFSIVRSSCSSSLHWFRFGWFFPLKVWNNTLPNHNFIILYSEKWFKNDVKKSLEKIKCEFMCSTIGYFIENKKISAIFAHDIMMHGQCNAKHILNASVSIVRPYKSVDQKCIL